MSRREDFERAFPEGTFLDPEDLEGLERYARSLALLAPEERLVAAGRAGEGNMNLTLRLKTSAGSFILKQSRPWVEKYPAIDAPPGRSRVEIAFYETVARRRKLARATPRLLASDPVSGALALEDLGEAQDFTHLYRRGELGLEELGELVDFLAELHRPWNDLPAERERSFANREMRALNHEHIFRLPLAADNGLDLDGFSPGLNEAARPIKEDRPYVDRVTSLGRLYLEDGDALVHGDYFPGSWLRTSDGIRVIDPEFCFLGTAAFDVGFMLGHLYLARQPESIGRELVERYLRRTGGPSDEREGLVRGFAGVEIVRRLIGVAQLPVDYGTDARAALLGVSRELVLP